MRLIQNMTTIAEYPTPDYQSNRVIKIAVIGGSGVGKTGKMRSSLCHKLYKRGKKESTITSIKCNAIYETQ